MDLTQYLNPLLQTTDPNNMPPSDIMALQRYMPPQQGVYNSYLDPQQPQPQPAQGYAEKHPYLSKFGDFARGFVANSGGDRDQFLSNGLAGGLGEVQKAKQRRAYAQALQQYLPNGVDLSKLTPEQAKQIMDMQDAKEKARFETEKWGQEYGIKQQDNELKRQEIDIKQNQFKNDQTKDITTMQATLNNALASNLVDINRYQQILKTLKDNGIDTNSPIASTTANTMLTQMGIVPYRTGQLQIGQQNADTRAQLADIAAQKNRIQEDYNNGRLTQDQAEFEWRKLDDTTKNLLAADRITAEKKPSALEQLLSNQTGQPLPKPRQTKLSPATRRALDKQQGQPAIPTPAKPVISPTARAKIRSILKSPNRAKGLELLQKYGLSEADVR